MGINTSYLVRINSTDIPKIKDYKVQRNKLWTDAGRNLAGDLRSTFIGIFPKIMLVLAPLTEAQMTSLITLLDAPSFTVSWWDAKTQTHKSGTFYAGDFEIGVLKKSTGMYEDTKFNLIPFNKLT